MAVGTGNSLQNTKDDEKLDQRREQRRVRDQMTVLKDDLLGLGATQELLLTLAERFGVGLLSGEATLRTGACFRREAARGRREARLRARGMVGGLDRSGTRGIVDVLIAASERHLAESFSERAGFIIVCDRLVAFFIGIRGVAVGQRICRRVCCLRRARWVP